MTCPTCGEVPMNTCQSCGNEEATLCLSCVEGDEEDQ